MPKTIALSSASNAGFHFTNLYQCCQRKFFIKYVIRPVAHTLATSLIYGIAFHEGKAVFYKTKSETKAKRKVIAEVKKYETLFRSPEDFNKTLTQVPILLQHWIAAFGWSDFERYDLIDVEGDYVQELPRMPGFVFTGRIDAVVRDRKNNQHYILETKTSRSSEGLTMNGVWYGDQATAYIWLASKKLNLDVVGVIADVAYWHNAAKYESNIKCLRSPEPITRTKQDVYAFVLGLQQTFSEISQKISAYEYGHDEAGLFPRNTFYCMSYGKPCEFADICRLKLKPYKMPIGFCKDRRKHSLGGMIEDQIAES